jgi:uncharacterized protein (DUF58 family)
MVKVWLFSSLVPVLFLAGLVSGYGYLFRLSYLVAGVLVVGWAWSRLALWGVEVTGGKRVQRAQVGMPLAETIIVANHSPMPKMGLELVEESDLPGRALRRTLSLGPWSQASIPIQTVCQQRGSFTLGPTWLIGKDPFGLFQGRRPVRSPSSLVVHPRVFSLAGFPSLSSEVGGEGRSPRRIPYVTPRVMGVREYYPGDSLNRIHWPYTARWQRLMVKEFEVDPAHDAWILLDLEEGVHWGAGQDSSEEYAVSIVASLAQHFLSLDLSLGLLAYGQPTVLLLPDRGSRQLLRTLDSLSTVRALGRRPLMDAILHQERRLGRNDLLTVVTPSPREDWVGPLQLLARRGVRVMVVLLEAGTFGGSQDSLLVFSTLAASRIPTCLVKRGDRLGQALGRVGGAR